MTRPRVLMTHPILEPGPQLIAAVADVEVGTEPSIRDRAQGCAGIVAQVMDPIGEDVLSLPGLKIVANCAVGFDNIDLAAATRHGVLATNTPGVLNDTTADFAFALLMAAARRVPEGDRFVRGGAFHGWAIDMLLGQDVHGATLGIVGIGRIGRAVARRARGFDMRVLYTDEVAPLNAGEEAELGVERRTLQALLAESDFVSLHVPLTPSTRHLIGPSQLALMKPGAVLVNTSRGPVIDEAALAEALREGRIFAAGLDVYEHEPQVHPDLLGLDNVVLAPHIASGSVQTRARMSELAALNLIAGLRGERPPNLLNPEAWKA